MCEAIGVILRSEVTKNLMRTKIPCVYILTNKSNKVLYTGVTSDLIKRVYEHKNHFVDGFTKRYNLNKLVFFEVHEVMEEAIKKEKRIKGWLRKKKIALIESKNPDWKDLYPDII